MQHCAFCGSEFPDDARFCGRCGRAPVATLDAPTTLSSGQAHLVPKKKAEEEEERRRRALLLALLFSPEGGQPGIGQVPMVQGTPQMSGVPVVQGTPQMNGAPAASAVSSSAASPAPSSPGLPQAPQSGARVAPPAASVPQKPMESPHPPQEPPHHERQGQHPPGKLHVPHSGGPAPARVIRSAPRWLHIALTGLVVLAASGITLALVRSHLAGGGTTPSRPGTITAFSLPTVGSDPEGIMAGPGGNLRFTEYNANKIGRITPGGATTGFSAPTDPASNASGALIADLPGPFLLLIQSGGSFVRRTPAR